MSPLEIAGMTLFILMLFLGIFTTVFGFPGTVIILVDAVIYALLTGFDKIGFKIILVLIILAVLGEAIDFGLSMAGAERFGASKKGVWASIIGGIIGIAIMSPFFYGLGMLAGAFLGGFAGVFISEILRQRAFKPALRAGYGSILGRAAAMLTKGFICLVMIIVVLINVYS
ncbi:MAG: DUF456 domain-containing protein [Syntrophaceae bacterium]|nr:DUF456 domain-containing protein [Syntrophaceae bacterium]